MLLGERVASRPDCLALSTPLPPPLSAILRIGIWDTLNVAAAGLTIDKVFLFTS